jgi:hypothetical protein
LDYPLDLAKLGFVFVGRPRSSKTTQIVILFLSALLTMKGAFVFDFKNGEYWDALSRFIPPGLLTRIDPFNRSSSRWEICLDIRSVEDAEAIGVHLAPVRPDEREPFFSETAGAYFIGGLVALHLSRPGDYDLLDLATPLSSFDSMLSLLRKAPEHNRGRIEQLKRARKMNRDVAETLLNRVSDLITVARRWREFGTGVSLVDVVSKGGFLINGHSHKFEHATAAITRAMVSRLTQLLLDEPNNDTPRWWVVLDELQSVGGAGKSMSQMLAHLLSKGPGKGVVPVLGFQSISTLRDVFGADAAASLNSYAGFKTFCAVNDPETAEWASSHFGDVEEIIVLQSESSGGEGGKVSRTRSEHIRETRVVKPIQFMSIPPLAPPAVNELGCYVVSPLFGRYYYDGITLELLQRVFPRGPWVAPPEPQLPPPPKQLPDARVVEDDSDLPYIE